MCIPYLLGIETIFVFAKPVKELCLCIPYLLGIETFSSRVIFTLTEPCIPYLLGIETLSAIPIVDSFAECSCIPYLLGIETTCCPRLQTQNRLCIPYLLGIEPVITGFFLLSFLFIVFTRCSLCTLSLPMT